MTRFTTMTAIACLAATGALAQDDPSGAATVFCQSAFSPGDTNADGMIQPEEAVAIASGAYESLDLDRDGSIDREELGTCLDGARSDMPRSADSDAFDRYDVDGSGIIEQDEVAAFLEHHWGEDGVSDTTAAAGFVNMDAPTEMTGTEPAGDTATAEADSGANEATQDAPEGDMANVQPTGPMSLEEFAARFGLAYRLLDRDRDEQISKTEFLERAEDKASTTEAELDQIFGSLDADASGDISREEYLGAADARMGLARQRAEEAGKLDPASGLMSVTTYYILR